MELAKLKSGSDIRGVALKEFTLDSARALCLGFSEYINAKNIFLGHDSRLSAKKFSDAITESLLNNSINVSFCSLCSTPSMFMTTILNGADGAIMLTASHHEKNKNGIKFFTKEGGVSSQQLDEIINLSQKYLSEKKVRDSKDILRATYFERDFLGDYCEYIRSYFVKELGGNMPLRNLKIAVDAGSGSSGFFAERILLPLGADISSSQYLEPDGSFPFHKPNPEDSKAIKSISDRVLKTHSDIGIIFDADGDRSAVVDSKGREINKNRLIALVSSILLKRQENKGAYIVTDSVTTKALSDFIVENGGNHIRYKRGYQNVISYAKKLNQEGKNAILAIETSSHAALKENFFLDDGAYLAAFLIINEVKLRREGKTLSDLILSLKEPREEKELRIRIEDRDYKKRGNEMIDKLESLGEVDKQSFEGTRVYLDSGYFTARLSVHDPVIVLNIDSDIKGGVKQIENKIFKVLDIQK